MSDALQRPRSNWAAAAVILIAVSSIFAAPTLLNALVPEPSVQPVGFYERIIFRGDGGEAGATAGLIAPVGWARLDEASPGTLVVSNAAASFTVSMHERSENAEALLRSSLPVGAAFLPTTSLAIDSSFDAKAIEFDLAAGDAPVLNVAICLIDSANDETPCLLIEAVYGTNPSGTADAQRESARMALSRMLASIEINT